MKRIIVILLLLVVKGSSAQSCKWGLYPDYKAAGVENTGDAKNNEVACKFTEQAAASRIRNAKTICLSGQSGVSCNMNDKQCVQESRLFLQQIQAAMSVAARGYTRVYACEHADLVAKFNVDSGGGENTSVEITDADSGDAVFLETRSIHDTSNDLYRLARHFQDARTAAANQAKESAQKQTAAEPR